MMHNNNEHQWQALILLVFRQLFKSNMHLVGLLASLSLSLTPQQHDKHNVYIFFYTVFASLYIQQTIYNLPKHAFIKALASIYLFKFIHNKHE